MTEPVKKRYTIELSETDMDLLYDALMFIQDHCKDDGQALYTTKDYNSLMDSFNNMIGVSE